MRQKKTSPLNPRVGLAFASGLALCAGAGLALAAPLRSQSDKATAQARPAGAGQKTLEARALQVLAERCFSCHAGKAQLSDLRLDSREALLKGGKRGPSLNAAEPGKSALLHALNHQGEVKMPPGEKLPAPEIALLTAWIRQGAPWPGGRGAGARGQGSGIGAPNATPNAQRRTPGKLWAFQPLATPQVPAVRMKGWVRNPIDAFVLAELERQGLKPSPYADRRTLIRRVTFDLTGLPPTPEEVEAFIADRSPNAYEKVVDRLLGSKHYGERLAVKWLDLARYADSDGYHDDTDRSMWPYRDYVINAFNQDKPFDQFTIEQLAGDTLLNATVEQKIASAFNRCGPTSSEGGAIPAEYLAKYAVDRVNTTASVWLGLTMGCVECHDHKYDPLSIKEYYQFFAFFNQVPEEALYRGADAPPTLFHPTPEQKQKLEELGKLAAVLEAEAKPRMGVADPKAEEARVADAKKKLESVKKERTEVERDSKVRIMADVPQRRPTHILLRGDYTKPGEEVQPAVPAVLGKLPEGVGAPRLALAKWLVDPSNALTPRVTVNRYWEMLFGKGLSRSSDDFGTRGEVPSHPELLDYLASMFSGAGTANVASGVRDQGLGVGEGSLKRGAAGSKYALRTTQYVSSDSRQPTVVRNPGLGWSTKGLLKLIVMSATYQQSSQITPALLAKDPANRLLARGPRFRLPAEMIRDNALAVSGLFDRERAVGGPSVKPYQPGDLWRELSAGDQEAKSYKQDHGPDLYRRGLYTFWKRSILYPAFAVFDAPKREVCTVERPVTNTPLQAFVTLNDTAFVEAARVFAQRILKEGGADATARFNYAYQRALARPATAEERKVLARVLEGAQAQYRQDKDAAAKLVSVGEYARPQELDVVELAAWTCVANAILNLDEAITKE